MSQKFNPQSVTSDDAAADETRSMAQQGSPELSAAQLEMVAGGTEQVMAIVSSSGAGAGKVTFNPFSITR